MSKEKFSPYHYIVEVFGGVEPKLHGTYLDDDERLEAAQKIGAEGDRETDSVFWLDVYLTDGAPIVEIGPYMGFEMNPEEYAEYLASKS